VASQRSKKKTGSSGRPSKILGGYATHSGGKYSKRGGQTKKTPKRVPKPVRASTLWQREMGSRNTRGAETERSKKFKKRMTKKTPTKKLVIVKSETSPGGGQNKGPKTNRGRKTDIRRQTGANGVAPLPRR